jgi:hypothetical protein
MADIDSFCAKCNKPLEGAVQVIRTTFRGTPVFLLKETPDRNWIRCKGCDTVFCKSCCRLYMIEFCNGCLDYVERISAGNPLKSVFIVSLSALRIWKEAASNGNSVEHKGGVH